MNLTSMHGQTEQKIFNKMHDVDIDSWNAMIGGFEIKGYKKYALKIFDMHDADIVL